MEEIEFEQQQPRPKGNSAPRPDVLADGRDEMNLVECPLSAVADRFLDGRKTVVFRDRAYDPERKESVDRELAISGSDRYGLPTARDEDVLLACVQLSALQGFNDREVRFSRYELLKLLRWSDEGKSYSRLATSLRRWKGVTIYSDRAFYDNARKSWVTRDFGVFDLLTLYEREAQQRASAPSHSRFVWNQVFFDSFNSGYLKKLDWDLYCRFSDPVAKRLYRLLDKRFYRTREVTFDLRDLAVRKVRLSETYDTAQIKRALTNGIRELEALWDLHPLPADKRFRRVRRGEWQVVFSRKRARARPTQVDLLGNEIVTGVVAELVNRGVGRSTAIKVVSAEQPDVITNALELFDWYGRSNQPKGAGLLVDAIRNPDKYQPPPGFESSARKRERKQAANSRNAAQRENERLAEAKQREQDNSRWRAFTAVWDAMSPADQLSFEQAAVAVAAKMKREGYWRHHTDGGSLFDHYRRVVLLDHFEQTRAG